MSMTKREHHQVDTLLKRYGTTYAEQCGIHLRSTPAPLFQLLVMSSLMSRPIRALSAVEAVRGLLAAGWTTPEKLAASTQAERTHVLNQHGYARFDESGARTLGELTHQLQTRYGGDLRTMYDASRGELADLRARLEEFQGIGPVGADIFLREAQRVWPHVRPFADQRAVDAAKSIGLADDTDHLAKLVRGSDRFALLVSALVQADLDGDIEDLRQAS